MARVTIDGNIVTVEAAKAVQRIKQEMPRRAYRVSNALRNAELNVLATQAGHGGRVYRIPGTRKYYTASAPGEVPAIRTGTFRSSWRPKTQSHGDTHQSIIETTVKVGNYVLGDILEHGTPGGKMAPRPHHEKILQKARPEAVRIYDEDYF